MIKTLFLSFIYLITIVPSLFSGTVQLNKLSKEIMVCPHAEYLEDTNGSLTIEDVKSEKYDKQWISSDKETLGFGYTNSVYWLRFVIENKSNADIEYFIEHYFSTIDEIKHYIYNNGNSSVIEAGDTRPFSQRSHNYRNFVFPFKLKANSSSSFYTRQATNDSMILKLKIWSPEAFNEMASTDYRLLAMFSGIILIMSLYNFIIFLFTRNREYLYYVFFISTFLLLMMIVNGTAFQYLWPDSPRWQNYSLPLFLFIMQVFLMLFCRELVELRTKRAGIPYRQILYKTTNILIAASAIILATITVISFRHPTQIAVLCTAIVISGIIFIGFALIVKERDRSAIFGLSAASTILFGGLAFILMSFGILPAVFLTEWSLYIGSVFMIALFSYALADRINSMTKGIIEAEKKYRELVESSDDIIFSLDENMTFLSVNRAIIKHLGYYEENVIGKNFLDFIHDSGEMSKHITREVIEGYAEDLKKIKKGINFRTDFKKRHTHEPVELSVKFTYTESKGREEKILGKASALTDDTILKYMKLEKNIFEADNYLNNAEILSQRLTQKLYRFLDRSDILSIRLSLREVLINAIEHGNLDINFDEKTNAMAKGNYLKYILDRQGDQRYRGRKIHVDYHLTEESVTYSIADEGKGFDYQNLTKLISEKSSDTVLPHGRGLMLVEYTFDKVEFNKKGNQVTLVKYFKKGK